MICFVRDDGTIFDGSDIVGLCFDPVDAGMPLAGSPSSPPCPASRGENSRGKVTRRGWTMNGLAMDGIE